MGAQPLEILYIGNKERNIGHTRKSRTSVWRARRVSRSQNQCLQSSRSQNQSLVFRLAAMIPSLLLLVLVNFIGGHVLHTNLINGSFRYKVGQKGFIVLDSRLNFANRKVRMMAL